MGVGSNNFDGTLSEGGEQQCVYGQVAPPHGTEIDTMGVDRLLQSMTGGYRLGSRWKLPAFLYSYKGLHSIYMCIEHGKKLKRHNYAS